MSTKQFDTLLKFEQGKEQQIVKKLQHLEQEYQNNLTRLSSVNDFRLEYLKRVSQLSLQGIGSTTYGHYHAFINKLDNAAEQVKIAIEQSKVVVEKNKQQWFKQRQKVQSVELLVSKRTASLALVAAKREQKMFDEMSIQQFIRRNYVTK